MNGIRVKREEFPHPALFGPVYWWGVWVGPFSKVATFAYWADAIYFANLAARSRAGAA